MSRVSAKKIRAALIGLAAETVETEGAITREAIRARLGVSTAKEGDALKDTIKRFVKSGELRVVGENAFEYVAEAAPPVDSGQGWERVYRAARIAKGAFDGGYVMKLAVVGASAAGQHLRAMVEGGYLEIIRREGSKIIYKATDLLKNSPAIPPEPKRERGQFVRARAAMAELNSLFITAELSTTAARRKILEQLEILGKEFGKEVEDDS